MGDRGDARTKNVLISKTSLLQNEASFDRLFCDVLAQDTYSIFYNRYFSDDPIFNHAKFSDAVLESENYSSSEVQVMFQTIVDRTKEFQIPASLYAERFWNNARSLESDAIDFGFVIIEQMHVLAKTVGSEKQKDSRIEVSFTEDVELWNNAFVKSFKIPEVWIPELRRRLESALSDPFTRLVVARESGFSEASGCLLLHNTPKNCMGVYCVGTVPERRSRGIAAAMMAEAELEARRVGCEVIVLQTVASDGVTPMYFKMGYETAFDRDVLQFGR